MPAAVLFPALSGWFIDFGQSSWCFQETHYRGDLLFN